MTDKEERLEDEENRSLYQFVVQLNLHNAPFAERMARWRPTPAHFNSEKYAVPVKNVMTA
jgi:hypothetical protein